MKNIKFILFLLTILLSMLMIISSAGCKGKKSEAVREKAPRVLEEETYDPCGGAVEESAEETDEFGGYNLKEASELTTDASTHYEEYEEDAAGYEEEAEQYEEVDVENYEEYEEGYSGEGSGAEPNEY